MKLLVLLSLLFSINAFSQQYAGDTLCTGAVPGWTKDDKTIIRVFSTEGRCDVRRSGRKYDAYLTVEDLLTSSDDDKSPYLFLGRKIYKTKMKYYYNFVVKYDGKKDSMIDFTIDDGAIQTPEYPIDARVVHYKNNGKVEKIVPFQMSCHSILITDDPCINKN